MAILDCPSASRADVASTISSASSGDTVRLPASASVTWNSEGVSIPGTKGIILDGNGSTITRGTGTTTLISVTTNASVGTRIKGFTLTQSNTARMITVGGGFANAKFRIDHCTLSSSAGLAILVVIDDAWGLIDHCTMSGDDASELIHNEAYGDGVTTGWGEDITIQPSTADALYIEDCTFSKHDQTDPFFWGTSALQGYYGSRCVVRFCTLNYIHLDQHGTAGQIGARWWEFYNNNFTIPAGGGNQSDYFGLRGGTGVVFDNTKSGGTNGGGGNLNMFEEDSGYPADYQVGRGKDQVLQPAYIWNNSSAINIADDDGQIDPNRDYYAGVGSFDGTVGVGRGPIASRPATCTAGVAYWATDEGEWNSTNGATADGRLYKATATNTWSLYYTPYTYPHPLQNEGPTRFIIFGPRS